MGKDTQELYDRAMTEIGKIDDKLEEMDSEGYHRIFIDRDELVEINSLLCRLELKLAADDPTVIHV